MTNLFENKFFTNYLPVIILAVFAVIFIAFAVSHKMGNYGVETDFYGLYAQDAQRILNGEMVKERDHAPGYTTLLALSSLIFGDFFLTGKILSVLSTVGILWVFFKLVRLLFNKEVALISLLLLALYLIPYSFVVGLDIVFTFFFLLSIYLFYRGNGRRRKWLIWSGVVSGITYLMRYNGILLPMGIFIVLLFLNFNGDSFRQRVHNFALYLLPFILIILPWFIFTRFVEGNSSSPGLNAAIAWEFYGPGGEFGGDQRNLVETQFSSLTAIVFHDIPHFVSHYVKNIFLRFEQFSVHGFAFPAFFFVLPGIMIALAISSLKKLSVFVFPVLGFLVLCLVNYLTRYYLFVFPFFVLLIGLFFISPFPDNRNFNWLSFKYIKWPVLLTVLLFVGHQSWFQARAEIVTEPRDLLHVAKILAKSATTTDIVIARKPHLAYFAGIKNENFPQVANLTQLVEYAKTTHSRFVFYGSKEQKFRPQLHILSEPDSISLQMKLIYRIKNNFLYEVK